MFDAFEKIPKGVNIFIFIWMLLGMYCILRYGKLKDRNFLYLYVSIIGFMIGWRIFIRIITSRYAAAMIIPFTLVSAVFFVNSVKRRRPVVRLAMYAIVICTSAIYLKMNFDSLSRYHYSTVVADIFKKANQQKDCDFAVRALEYNRTSFLCRSDKVGAVRQDSSFRDYLEKNKEFYHDIILNYQIKNEDDELAGWKNLKKIASLPQNEDGTKKQIVCSFSTE